MSDNIKDIKLTQYAKTSGWAAKVGPDILAQVLCHLPKQESDNLIVGLDTADDAAVYKINEDTAIIQTLDFFTPIVDDPYTFGKIAAANSLSDVYAMGGKPIVAMNIVCFPNCLSPEVLVEILKGGSDKVREAECLLVGGHTVQDDEPKYGLSVSGLVHPDKVWTNSGAKPGDCLVLTKPIGVGIINTALKGGLIEEKSYAEATRVMETLNAFGQKEAYDLNVNACTDITGFGLAGHAYEMAEGSDVSIEIFHDKVPMIDKAIEYAQMGLIPAGAYNNRLYIGNNYEVSENVEDCYMDIMFDPQTSGGLLFSLPLEDALTLEKRLEKYSFKSKIIGTVSEKKDKFLYFI